MNLKQIIEVHSSSPEPMPISPDRAGFFITQGKTRAGPSSRKVTTHAIRPKSLSWPQEQVIEIFSDSDDERTDGQKENPATVSEARDEASSSAAGLSQIRNAHAGGSNAPIQGALWYSDLLTLREGEVVGYGDLHGEHADPFVFGPLVQLPTQLAPTPSSNPTPLPIEATPPLDQVVTVDAGHCTPPLTADPFALQNVFLEEDSIAFFVAQILEIVPDVEPGHVRGLVDANILRAGNNLVEHVLHILFETPNYPRIDRKGKRKHVEIDGGGSDEPLISVRQRIDYASTNREHMGGEHYRLLALERLTKEYPFIPKAHIKFTFAVYAHLYAPTYLALRLQQNAPKPPFKRNATGRLAVSKGKQRAVQDGELEKEVEWVVKYLVSERAREDAKVAQKVNEQEYGENEDGIECGCCFSVSPFDKMVQCPDAHLFCIDCATQYASTQLGEHNVRLVCMDQSGCKLAFPESELRRFLSPKLLELYERVKTRKELEDAGIEGLEECPFCEYRVVIENPEEKLFRCERQECGAVSCRGCKKLDHLPKSCKEVEDDKRLGAQHRIEEAMTQALMRNCPKCQKAFIKESGCNKMTCPTCRTMSCYKCREVIQGYDHFGQNQPGIPGSSTSLKKRCQLWDANLTQQQDNEVNEAAQRALAEFRRENPEEDAANLQIDIPLARAVGNSTLGHIHRPGVLAHPFGHDWGVEPINQAWNLQQIHGGNDIHAHVLPRDNPHHRALGRERERRLDLQRALNRERDRQRELIRARVLRDHEARVEARERLRRGREAAAQARHAAVHAQNVLAQVHTADAHYRRGAAQEVVARWRNNVPAPVVNAFAPGQVGGGLAGPGLAAARPINLLQRLQDVAMPPPQLMPPVPINLERRLRAPRRR